MKVFADLHLHSRFSRAVSKTLTLEKIYEAALKKGLHLVGTGDCLHPLWLREIKAFLEERYEGIYGIRGIKNPPFFILSTEVSCIYSHGKRLRKIHLIVLFPNLFSLESLVRRLNHLKFNLMRDGRPIFGMSAKEFLKICLETDEKIAVIPAHIWTPWFSLYGSNSGFDSLIECFDEYSRFIRAVETGLSSDPLMNWNVKDLDDKRIVSFSDAHSKEKIGREITCFLLSSFSYSSLIEALGKEEGISFTLEFYPEEGKYHLDGHRFCKVSFYPDQTQKLNGICPVCKKNLTIGVLSRVTKLSSRQLKPIYCLDENGVRWVRHPYKKRAPFVNLVPLLEVLMEVYGVKSFARNVLLEYDVLVKSLGGEIKILLETDLKEIEKVGGELLSQAIEKIRKGELLIEGGFDGQYGRIKIFQEGQARQKAIDQRELF